MKSSVNGNCKEGQFVSEFYLEIVKILLLLPNACYKGGVQKPAFATALQVHLWLWSQLADKLFVPHGDFFNS